jgi:hypothetical protein
MTKTTLTTIVFVCVRVLSPGLLVLGACGTRTNLGQFSDAGSSGGAPFGTGGGADAGSGGGGSGGGSGSNAVGGGSGLGGGGAAGGGCAIARGGNQPIKSPVFMDLRTYHAGMQPRSLTLGDLNGDGYADMVVIDRDGVNVLLNDTNSNFFHVVSYVNDAPNSLYAVALGDVDGDGKLDLAVSGGSRLTVLLNDGSGGFVAPVKYAFGGGSFFLADVNADGRTDIVVDGNSVLLNNGNRTFTSAVLTRTFAVTPSLVNPSPSNVTFGDIDGDGRADIVTATNSLAVSLGTSSGTFASPTPFADGVSGPILMRDLNGDCRNDIVGYNSGEASILLNAGGGKFAIGVDYNFILPPFDSAAVLAVGDLNNDGNPDLAMATFSTDGSTPGGLGVLLNDGSGAFPIAVPLPTGQNVNSIAIADVNGDGKPDLVAAYESGVDLLLNLSP